MNGIRNVAMWLGIAAVATGVIGVIAAVMGDQRVGTIVIGQSRELGVGIWVVALGVIVLGVAAAVTQYRPLAGAGLMLVGVLGVLVGQWPEVSQWYADLWASGTGNIVAYVDEQGLAHMPDVWGVLFGSLTMLGYAGATIFGITSAIVATFAPQPEAKELRTAIRPAAI